AAGRRRRRAGVVALRGDPAARLIGTGLAPAAASMAATTSGGVAMPGWRLCGMAAAVLLLAGSASTGKEMSARPGAQYSGPRAIRWNDCEGAWNLVDPDWREGHPLHDLQLERYRQTQVSHYRDLASSPGESEAMREIEFGVINRHTM